MKDIIGIFGGTFDPIHRGHLEIADMILHRCHCAQIRFIPCKAPVLKPNSQASAQDRLEMIRLAIKSHPRFVADDRELKRESPSYMVETLQSLRSDFPDAILLLIVGEDSFAELTRWHQWEKLFDLSHLVVISRQHADKITDPALLHHIAESEIEKATWLTQKQSGYLLKIIVPPILYSSTAVRKAVAKQKNLSSLCTVEVIQYIESKGLYR